MEYERHEFTQPLYGGVNVLRIGDALVDTGHVAPVCSDAVRDELDGPLAGVERVVHTHPHVDHVGGSQVVDDLAGLPHVVPAGQPSLLAAYADYLERAREEMTRLLAGFSAGGLDIDGGILDVYFPLRDDYAGDSIPVARELADGDVVTLGGYDLEAVSTPGHAEPHLAFWHAPSGTLFPGDLVDPDGRFQYGPLLGDVGAYKESLRRVRALEPDVLVPMHGPTLTDTDERIEASLANAAETEARILEYLSTEGPAGGDPAFARAFVADELGVDGPQAPFLTLVVYEYLRHLEERDLVEVAVTDAGIEAVHTGL